AAFPRRSSVAPQSRQRRRPPARSCTLLGRVEYPHAAHQGGRAAVADRGDLTGLALAAVEGAAEHVGLRPPDGFHRAPEVRGGGLVRDVAQLAVEAPVPDPEETLPGELEVVPLHVDRPALVAQ